MFQLSSQKDDLGSSSCPRPAVKSLHVSIWDSPLISFTSFDLGQCFCPLPVLMLLSYLHTRLPLHLPAMLLQSALLYKCSVPDIKPRRKKSSISTQIYDYVKITIANRPRTLFIRCVWARDYVCVRACVLQTCLSIPGGIQCTMCLIEEELARKSRILSLKWTIVVVFVV